MKRKAGFSIVEFLVVLAIIALVLTLLLPAFVRGREAARRISCVNNLKQIALALQSYQATHNVLPSGCYDRGDPVADPVEDAGDRMSWITSIIPFAEQNGVFGAIDFNVGVFDVRNQTARRTSMSMLLCPTSDVWHARQMGYFSMWSPMGPPPPPSDQDGLTSYAGCHHDVEAPIAADNHGVFFRNSRIRTIDVTDGLSQTLYIGELAFPSSLGWMSGSRSTLRNTGHPINGVSLEALGAGEPPGALVASDKKAEDLERMIDAEQITLPRGFVGGFGSRHGPGANFAFGDGSVRFLVQSIDPAVLRLLGNRSDGEAIDDSSY